MDVVSGGTGDGYRFKDMNVIKNEKGKTLSTRVKSSKNHSLYKGSLPFPSLFYVSLFYRDGGYKTNKEKIYNISNF